MFTIDLFMLCSTVGIQPSGSRMSSRDFTHSSSHIMFTIVFFRLCITIDLLRDNVRH